LRSKIAVIGQGYVGLPLAISAAEAGYRTFGIDLDLKKVEIIGAGKSTIEDVSNDRVKKQIESGNYSISNDFALVSECKIIVICVPTPLNSEQLPDLSYILQSAFEISKYLTPETLVILESTVAPGTTRNLLIPNLLKHSKLTIDQIDVAFSPERIDPMNSVWNLHSTPKIVSGLSERAKIKAIDFYSKFIKEIIECESLEIAETSKLLENSFRLINISFINEISMFCRKLGIDVNKVISAASTKPYGFMPFFPSLGIGGHCIPVDPVYLSHKAKEIESNVSLVDLSLKINLSVPNFFVKQAEDKLGTLANKKIIVLGVAYKSNISDYRETPVESLILGLREKNAQVVWHDELVKVWKNEKSTPLSSDFDLAIIATPHDYFDLTKLGSVQVINTRESI
jgi:UDP-N-acetyl-D-glucosamine dehydrogenase